MMEAFVLDGLRTPIGRHAGALAGVRPDDLAARVIRALVDRAPVAPGMIEDVVLGCACQAGEDGRNIGRNAALRWAREGQLTPQDLASNFRTE
ncbi:MAG: hypothetical protein HQL41_03250, partial [Alphaproteobacteria bacterium]|nr:hypothetical protein [Alphaproteobacteria bacterium]